jgi:hypothetical protein
MTRASLLTNSSINTNKHGRGSEYVKKENAANLMQLHVSVAVAWA